MAWVVGSPGSDAGTLIVAASRCRATTAGLGANGWRRFGPLRATVGERHLDLRYSGAKDQKLAGVAFYACGAVAGGLPPSAFLNEPKDGSELVAPVKVTIKADAYSPDGEISRVEFLRPTPPRSARPRRPPTHSHGPARNDGAYRDLGAGDHAQRHRHLAAGDPPGQGGWRSRSRHCSSPPAKAGATTAPATITLDRDVGASRRRGQQGRLHRRRRRHRRSRGAAVRGGVEQGRRRRLHGDRHRHLRRRRHAGSPAHWRSPSPRPPTCRRRWRSRVPRTATRSPTAAG